MRRGSRFGPHGARRRRSLTSRTLLHMWRTRPDGRSRRHGCARAGGAVARTPASEALRESRPASRARRRGGPRRDRARPLHPTALPRQALSCPWAPGSYSCGNTLAESGIGPYKTGVIRRAVRGAWLEDVDSGPLWNGSGGSTLLPARPDRRHSRTETYCRRSETPAPAWALR